MIIDLEFNKKKYRADLLAPFDISLPLNIRSENPSCYWAEPVRAETISSGNFIGSVKAGGSVNYQKLTLTPHGNGTHTECYGHISDDDATLNKQLKKFHFVAEVVSVAPEKMNEDYVINKQALQTVIKHSDTQAIVIRTLPNASSKKTAQYSGKNPPYLDPEAVEYLVQLGITQLLIDLPSIDREVDGGKLLAHRAFWNYPTDIRNGCTLTELIFVDDTVSDGLYLLNLQITSLELDASPSKPVLYKLTEVS